MLSQMSRKKAIWGNQESKRAVCMCKITIAVHVFTWISPLLEYAHNSFVACDTVSLNPIDRRTISTSLSGSWATSPAVTQATFLVNLPKKILTPKKSQNYWFQTPKNLKFGLALNEGIYFKRDLWGTAVIRSLTYFCCCFSVLFLLFPEPSYSGPDEVHFFRGPALDVSKHFIYLFIYWFSKHNINYTRQGCCLKGAWLPEAPAICSWVTKI